MLAHCLLGYNTFIIIIIIIFQAATSARNAVAHQAPQGGVTDCKPSTNNKREKKLYTQVCK